jgi:hypothetical protein
MSYTGHIEDGKIVLEDEALLPEGAKVRVEVIELASVDTEPTEKELAQLSSLSEFLLSIAGKAEGLPPDASINHDHYIYGSPKVQE